MPIIIWILKQFRKKEYHKTLTCTRHKCVECLCLSYRFLLGESWNLKLFSQNSSSYLKNHCANTRLVCTHLNAFFMLNPNKTMKNLKFEILGKEGEILKTVVVCTWQECCVKWGLKMMRNYWCRLLMARCQEKEPQQHLASFDGFTVQLYQEMSRKYCALFCLCKNRFYFLDHALWKDST